MQIRNQGKVANKCLPTVEIKATKGHGGDWQVQVSVYHHAIGYTD